SVPVPLGDVESELAQQMRALQGAQEHPGQFARMSNLVIFCDQREQAERIAADIAEVVSIHPARVLLLLGENGRAETTVSAAALVRPRKNPGEADTCYEMVTLHTSGAATSRLPFAVRALLVGDLPTNLWWASNQPPPFAGALL